MLQPFTFLFRCSETVFFLQMNMLQILLFTYASLLHGEDMASSKSFYFLPQIDTDPAIKLKSVLFSHGRETRDLSSLMLMNS